MTFFLQKCDYIYLTVQSDKYTYSYMGLVATKPVFGFSDKARLKPVSSAT